MLRCTLVWRHRFLVDENSEPSTDAREDASGNPSQNALAVRRLELRGCVLEQRFIHTKTDLPIQSTPRFHLGLNEGHESYLNCHVSQTSPVDSFHNGCRFGLKTPSRSLLLSSQGSLGKIRYLTKMHRTFQAELLQSHLSHLSHADVCN